jgi:hypothetical protein
MYFDGTAMMMTLTHCPALGRLWHWPWQRNVVQVMTCWWRTRSYMFHKR